MVTYWSLHAIAVLENISYLIEKYHAIRNTRTLNRVTPHHFQDSEAHRRFFLEHFKIKGREAAEACLEILALRATVAPAA